MRDMMKAASPRSSVPEGLPSSQSLLTSLVSDSTSRHPRVSAPGHARAYHSCAECPVMIPVDRRLCHFCSRTSTATEIVGSGVACPMCLGNINDVDHFVSGNHMRSLLKYA